MSTSSHLPVYVPPINDTVLISSTLPNTDQNIEIGYRLTNPYTSSILIGTDLSTDPQCICIGVSSKCVSGNSVCIGRLSRVNAFSVALGWTAIADTSPNTPNNGAAVAIGSTVTASGQHSIAMGTLATTTATDGISIGHSASVSATKSIAIGLSSSSTGINSVAIGYLASAAAFTTSTALGKSATCTANNQIMLGTATESVVCAGTATALQVAGKIKANGTAPTFTAVTGTSPAAGNWSAAAGSCDVAGTATTGANNASGAGAFTVTITFASTYTSSPFVVVVPASSNITNMYVSTVTATTVIIGGNAVGASPLLFNYSIVGRY